MHFLKTFTDSLNKGLVWVAGAILMVMVFLTFANIVLRLLWLPISGTVELMGYFGAIVTAFALGYTQLRKGHISVDILVLGFSQKTQRNLAWINDLICMAFFAAVAWQLTRYAGTLWKTGEVSETLRFPYFPFTYGVALGCAVLSLVFLTDFLNLMVRNGGDET